jgi:iron complex outermembrane receptor protein
MNYRSILRPVGILALASGALIAPKALAADAGQAAAAPAGEEPVALAPLVVTGSNIPTSADTTDVPVTIVSSQDIADTGDNANLLDILRKEIPAFGGRSSTGNANATNANQNTAGGSEIQLRNLDTLVLINGRRVAASGANGDNGGKSFVDVNQIPTAAIDHVEVLTDGASAIYGSDAVGGVINIILKTNYQGSEIGGRFAISQNKGDYTEKSGYFVAGASTNGVSLTVTGSWSETAPLWQNQRAFIASNLQAKSSFPGIAGGDFLSPGINSPSQSNPVGLAATAPSFAALVANGTYQSGVPLFNLSPYQTILQQTNQKAITAAGTVEIVPKHLTGFGDLVISDTHAFLQTNGFLNNLASVTVPAGAPYNPLTVAATGVIAGTLALPLKTFDYGRGERITGGFRGEINDDWSWEIGGTYSGERLEQDLANELFMPNITLAVAGGYNSANVKTPGGNYSQVIQESTYPAATNLVYQPALDPFARQTVSAASIANLYGTEVILTSSILKGVDTKLVGTPFSLPAGKFAIAVGAAYRIESLSATPDLNSYALSINPAYHNWGAGGVFFGPFSHERSITSFWAETRLPITSPTWNVVGLHALDLSLAGRDENYSGTGRSDVPKIGLRWQPVDDQVTFRYTYSKAFTAPDMWHQYGPPSVTAASSATFFQSNLGPTYPLPANHSYSYFSGNGNNPNLQPSHAWSRSAGVVISPKAIKGLTISVNYVNVFQKGLAAGAGAGNDIASVNALGSASPDFSAVAIGGIPGTPGSSQTLLAAPGGLYNYVNSPGYKGDIYIADHFINSGGLHVEAFDFNPEYTFRTESMGTFTLGTDGTWMDHFLFSAIPGAPFYEFAGYSTNTQTEAGSFPRLSFYTTLDWKYHEFEGVIGNSYMSSMTDVGTPASGLTYAPANYLLTHPAVPISYYTSWDLQLNYTVSRATAQRLAGWLRGSTFGVGVNDLFNRMPPYAGISQAAANNNNNVDVTEYSPIGRLYYVSGTVKF